MIKKFLFLSLCVLGFAGLSIVGTACSQDAQPYIQGQGYNPYRPYPTPRPYPGTCERGDSNCEDDNDDRDRGHDRDDDDDSDDSDGDECDHDNPDFENPNCTFWSDFGATSALEPTNAFEDFADIMDLNTDHIDNIQFNLSVSDVGTSVKALYGGTIKIGFYNEEDNEINEAEGEAQLNASQVPYNHWVIHDKNSNNRGDVNNAEHYIKMFFEVQGGALIVVAYPKGDNHLLTGEIFFREFDSTRCARNSTWPWFGCGSADFYRGGNHCWLLPYDEDHFKNAGSFNPFNVHDCRAFVVDKERDNGKHARVDTSSSIHPGVTVTGSYKSIGKFSNMVPEDAGIKLPYSR